MKKKLFISIVLAGSILNASAQLKVGDQPTVIEKSVALDVKGSNGQQGLWLPRVSDTSVTGIRALNPPNGLLIYHTPSGKIFLRSNNAWIAYLESAIQSVTAGGTTITGPALTYNTGTAGTDFNVAAAGNTATWNLPDASTTARGAVTVGAQTFGGAKTFANGVTVNNGATLNNGTTANNGLSVTGATASASNLTLGVTSATTPAAQTDRYLSVNASGVVTLNTMNSLQSVTAGGTTMTGPALIHNTGTAGTDFNISGSGNTATWNLPNASTTARGAVTNTAQTFGGNKTFNDSLRVNNGSTLNGGTMANGGLTVSGASGVNSATTNLTLGVNSSTTPIGTTDKFLSVDAQGKVTLNSMNIVTNNALKIKTYFKVIDNAPMNLPNNTPTMYTFTFSGENLSTSSSVVVTPLFQFKLGTAIHYARVVDANTVEMVMTYWAGGGTQPINTGTNGTYNITIIEF